MNLISYTFYSATVGFLMIVAFEISLGFYYGSKDASEKNQRIEKNISHPNANSETVAFAKEVINFREYSYSPFIGWKASQVNGDLINVDDKGRRRTVSLDQDYKYGSTIHLFGGSTMWGYGVADDHTIPSHLSNINGIRTINYGEQAYNSRQELNLLLNHLADIEQGDVIVFYDGVNDVYHNCKSTNSVSGHAREYAFKEAIKAKENRLDTSDYLAKIFLQSNINRLLLSLQDVPLSRGSSVVRAADVCTSDDSAKKVAEFLVQSWSLMSLLAIEKGVIPLCVLQPSPYTLGKPVHAKYPRYGDQIEAVYPLIREKAKDLECFVDLSHVFEEDVYTDSCCHVTSKGNEIVSRAIWSEIKGHAIKN